MEPEFPSIHEFLDSLEKECGQPQPAIYHFYEHEEIFLKVIPEDSFGYEVLKKPSEGKPGLARIYLKPYAGLSDVFNVTQATPATYVDRKFDETRTYEVTLELTLKQSGQIILMHGPSKLGKTVLWKSVLKEEDKYILISCSNDLTIEKIYQYILFELGEPSISQRADEEARTSEKGKSRGLKIGTKDAAQAEIGKSSSQSEKTGKTETQMFPPIQYNVDTVTKALSGKGIAIIFENFHRLEKDTFKRICVDLRAFSDRKINTLFAGIPNDPYEIIGFNRELEGRVKFMEFKFWRADDLQKIALGGQEELRASFTQNSLDFLSEEAASSPFLMQYYCYISCIISEIHERQKERKEIDFSKSEFAEVLKVWGIQILKPSQIKCEILKFEGRRMKYLPTNFLDLILEKIKKSKASLSINLNEFDFWPKEQGVIRAYISKLDGIELTRDIFSLDEQAGILNINDPFLISYIRWIHEK